MGFSGISIWQLLIILAIVVLIFGTKRLKGMGTDVGSFIKGFRGAMSGADNEGENKKPNHEEKKLANESKSSFVNSDDLNIKNKEDIK